MKIAHIVLKGMPGGGGIETLTENLACQLVENGHEVTVYTMRHYGARDGLYRGIKIKTVPSPKNRSLEKLTAAMLATLYESCWGDADIVHFHAFGPAVFSLFPRMAGRKVVVQGHGLEWKRSKWGRAGRVALRLLEGPSVKFPHVVTVPSLVHKKYLKDRYGIEATFIPQAISPPQREEPELIKTYNLQGRNYILFVGRLVPEKGIHYLIEAFRKLNTDKKLVIAGDASYEDEYKAKLSHLAGKDERIIFLGFVTGKFLRELFSNCYLFVLPSELEGMSIALLEAMSYGNCCLASDIPENVEGLSGLGYTFKSRDIEDLREKLNNLLADEQAVASVQKAAYDYIMKSHDWASCATRFETLYRSLV